MHSLYFVLLPKKEAESSQEARKQAINILDQGNFVYSGGYWGGGKADWFVVGGRCSGILQEMVLGIDRDEISTLDKNRKNILSVLWKKKKGQGECPVCRDTYKTKGYADDAMPVNKLLYDRLVKYYPDIEVYDSENFREVNLSDFKAEEMIGKWIVVIDYHC